MPWASVSMLDGPGGTGKIIHIIVQDQDGQNNNHTLSFEGSKTAFYNFSITLEHKLLSVTKKNIYSEDIIIFQLPICNIKKGRFLPLTDIEQAFIRTD